MEPVREEFVHSGGFDDISRKYMSTNLAGFF